MNDLTRGRTVGPAGVIGENAKIKPATVIQVIRIKFNRSNKICTYQKLYPKSVHKFYQPRQVVGAAGSQKSEKAKKDTATEGSLLPSIYTNKINRLHASNEVRRGLYTPPPIPTGVRVFRSDS